MTCNGFRRGLMVERIDSVFINPNGSVMYNIKFKDQPELERVPADVVKLRIPDMVMEFYWSRLSYFPIIKRSPRKRKAGEE
ncbi:heterochromatin protein 1 [Drosophila takahashii]|uniref:heterochromatin protein 1 n=1 Tax=Drosophila takahashii TaxID=29030 RepID=UPI0007E6262B